MEGHALGSSLRRHVASGTSRRSGFGKVLKLSVVTTALATVLGTDMVFADTRVQGKNAGSPVPLPRMAQQSANIGIMDSDDEVLDRNAILRASREQNATPSPAATPVKTPDNHSVEQAGASVELPTQVKAATRTVVDSDSDDGIISRPKESTSAFAKSAMSQNADGSNQAATQQPAGVKPALRRVVVDSDDDDGIIPRATAIPVAPKPAVADHEDVITRAVRQVISNMAADGQLPKPAGKPGFQQGFHPGSQPGFQQGFHPGSQPGFQQGFHPGSQPGFQPGFQPPSQSGVIVPEAILDPSKRETVPGEPQFNLVSHSVYGPAGRIVGAPVNLIAGGNTVVRADNNDIVMIEGAHHPSATVGSGIAVAGSTCGSMEPARGFLTPRKSISVYPPGVDDSEHNYVGPFFYRKNPQTAGLEGESTEQTVVKEQEPEDVEVISTIDHTPWPALPEWEDAPKEEEPQDVEVISSVDHTPWPVMPEDYVPQLLTPSSIDDTQPTEPERKVPSFDLSGNDFPLIDEGVSEVEEDDESPILPPPKPKKPTVIEISILERKDKDGRLIYSETTTRSPLTGKWYQGEFKPLNFPPSTSHIRVRRRKPATNRGCNTDKSGEMISTVDNTPWPVTPEWEDEHEEEEPKDVEVISSVDHTPWPVMPEDYVPQLLTPSSIANPPSPTEPEHEEPKDVETTSTIDHTPWPVMPEWEDAPKDVETTSTVDHTPWPVMPEWEDAPKDVETTSTVDHTPWPVMPEWEDAPKDVETTSTVDHTPWPVMPEDYLNR
ncbi:histone-lysine N-methyltransferase 2D-like [Babesia ovis]|uniref:Histone-lysine N-methyltransferase 2D-like n=1 Tax=Babesia ovis TaxID=5869 RepID=A0A9W5TEF9_BABOV|nr:histone-lysine N-methyltransferase 2D-like [Babesia ovis]